MQAIERFFADLGSAAFLMSRRDWSREGLAQALATYLWRPLPALIVLGVLTGLMVGLGMAELARHFRAEQVVGARVSVLVARDIVPLLAGVLAAGRVSAVLAARLDEDAGATGPALAAAALSAPLHAAVGVVAVWLTVGAVMQQGGLIPWPIYFDLTLTKDTHEAVFKGIVRTLTMVVAAVAAGAAAGGRGELGVPARMTRAFTAGLIAVAAVSVLWIWLS